MMSKLPIDLNERFYIFDNLLTSNKHLLKRKEEEHKKWNSSKIFFQLAIEHGNNSPLSQDADRFEKDGKVDWNYLRDTNRREKFLINPLTNLITLKQDISKVELKNDRLSVYTKNKYFIYSKENFQKIDEITLESDNLNINDIDKKSNNILDAVDTCKNYHTLNNGDLFCYGGLVDRDVIIRDAKTLEQKAIIKGHGGKPVYIQELSNGDIATISYQRAFRILRDYKEIYKLDELHNDEVLGFFYDDNTNELITYSKDKTVKKLYINLKFNPLEQSNLKNLAICNDFEDYMLMSGIGINKLDRETYKIINTNTEHEAPVTSIVKLNNFYFATASMDKTIKIFDINTFKSIATLVFKEKIPMINIKKISNNEILIYAYYGNTTYLFNTKTLECTLKNKNNYNVENFKNIDSSTITTYDFSYKELKWFSDKEKDIKFIDEKRDIVCIKDGKKSIKFLKVIHSKV